jgi:hypothetical protein
MTTQAKTEQYLTPSMMPSWQKVLILGLGFAQTAGVIIWKYTVTGATWALRTIRRSSKRLAHRAQTRARATSSEQLPEPQPSPLRQTSAPQLEEISIIEVEQDFNTIVIKKIQKGEKILSHVDSRNTVGKSISIILGNFKDAKYRMDDFIEEVNPGDVIVQECTNGYAMGPSYSMYPLQDGIQYAITICTILKENPV